MGLFKSHTIVGKIWDMIITPVVVTDALNSSFITKKYFGIPLWAWLVGIPVGFVLLSWLIKMFR